MRKAIPAFEPIPFWYGISFYKIEHDLKICYPIPVHLFVRWIRRFFLFVKYAGSKDQYRQAFHDGVMKGRRESYTKPSSQQEYDRGFRDGYQAYGDNIIKHLDEKEHKQRLEMHGEEMTARIEAFEKRHGRKWVRGKDDLYE